MSAQPISINLDPGDKHCVVTTLELRPGDCIVWTMYRTWREGAAWPQEPPIAVSRVEQVDVDGAVIYGCHEHERGVGARRMMSAVLDVEFIVKRDV